MVARTAFTRLLLRRIKWTADASSITLEAALKNFATARSITGKEVTSASAGGHSTSQEFDLRGMSPGQITEAVSELLDLYDLTKAASPAATDATIYATMLLELQPVTSFTKDYSSLRSGTSVVC